MDVGSFPKRPDREGMPIRAYRDIFTRRFHATRLRQLVVQIAPAICHGVF